MRQWVNGIGTKGVNKDINPLYLDHMWWTDASNVRFEDGKVIQDEGLTEINHGQIVANGVYIWCGLTSRNNIDYLLVHDGNGNLIYSIRDNGTIASISKASGTHQYTGVTFGNIWKQENFGNITILNSFNTLPQFWNSTYLADLTNWPASTYCYAIRIYKSFWVALGIRKPAADYFDMVKWSHPADPSTVPSSWDETDATKLAGEWSLPDSNKGKLVDGRVLGNSLFLFKESSMWSMTYSGGLELFDFESVNSSIGVGLYKDSLCRIPGNDERPEYLFWTDGYNFYVFDGQRLSTVLDGVMAKTIRDAIRSNYTLGSYTFTTVNPWRNEIWICVPTTNALVNTAYVWNYKYNTMTIRECDETRWMASGFSDISTVTGNKQVTVTVNDTNYGVWENYIGSTDMADDPIVSYVERISLPNIGTNKNGDPVVDYSIRKQVKSIVLKNRLGNIKFQIGTQEEDTDTITWSSEFTFSTGYRYDLATPITGRFLSFRFLSDDDEPFGFDGFDYEIELLGEY